MNRDTWWWRFWDRHHVKAGWIAVGFLVGGTAGVWVWSYASCRNAPSGCTPHWDAVEAVGTWFGAVGGLLAVGGAIATLRSGEKTRVAEQADRKKTAAQKEASAVARASRVTFSVPRLSWTDSDLLIGIQFVVRNANTDVPVYNAEVHFDVGTLVKDQGVHKVVSTRTLTENDNIERDLRLTDRAGATKMGAGHIEAPRLQRKERATIVDQIIQNSTLTYVIDNVKWKRVGTGEPERVPDAD